MKILYASLRLLVLILLVMNASHAQKKKSSAAIYFPEAGQWQTRTPAQVGMDGAKVEAAIAFAKEKETKNPRNLEASHYQSYGKEPFGEAIGPFATRGEPTGVIIRNGYIIAQWGEPSRVDMTFSVTKSFVSSVVGVAYDRGLIKTINDSVYKYMAPIQLYRPVNLGNKADAYGDASLLDLFSTPHNKTITWDHMLRQVSDWEGTLWGKPEWADRPSTNPAEWTTRPRTAPGTVYEYNDVRVNALALAALNVWRRPLPQVLKENIMDPIGASNTWRWMGYENSWVVLDGQIVQAVGGGGHWGGGMFISAQDMARFGYLTLRRGQWNGKQILSDQWVTWALTPTKAQPTYGFMNWFLNTDKKYLPSAPASAFAHIGNGTNMIYVDYENDIVAVVRWIDNTQLDGFVQRLLEAINK